MGSLFDVLVPDRCVLCGRGEALLCAPCLAGLQPVRPPLCTRCGAPTAWPVARCADCTGRRLAFASARAALVYDALGRRLVSAWKERGLRRLTPLLACLVVEAIERPAVTALTFVPAEADRARRRGQDPPAALARALGRAWELPVEPLLRRRPGGRRQAGLTREARRANVRGSFLSTGAAPVRVGLVDDVLTTGATVGAAATELRRSGARAVHVVALARAVRR